MDVMFRPDNGDTFTQEEVVSLAQRFGDHAGFGSDNMDYCVVPMTLTNARLVPTSGDEGYFEFYDAEFWITKYVDPNVQYLHNFTSGEEWRQARLNAEVVVVLRDIHLCGRFGYDLSFDVIQDPRAKKD